MAVPAVFARLAFRPHGSRPAQKVRSLQEFQLVAGGQAAGASKGRFPTGAAGPQAARQEVSLVENPGKGDEISCSHDEPSDGRRHF